MQVNGTFTTIYEIYVYKTVSWGCQPNFSDVVCLRNPTSSTDAVKRIIAATYDSSIN